MSNQEWLSKGNLIDVKTSGNVWEVGRIQNVKKSKIIVLVQNESMRLPITSKNFAPFRRYSLTSSLYSLTSQIDSSLLESIEKTIKSHLSQGFESISAEEITQFYRGELLIVIHSLISKCSCNLVRNPP